MLSKEEANDLAKTVENKLPENTGFCILLFPFNDSNGRMQYISNGDRKCVAEAIKEWLDKVDTDEKFGKDL